MSVEMRAYADEHGDPVVVRVTTGTYDVSRLVGLHAGGRCEDHDLAHRETCATTYGMDCDLSCAAGGAS